MSPAVAPFDLRPVGPEEAGEPRSRGARRLPPSATTAAGESVPEAAAARRPVRVARGINAVLVALCLLGSLQGLGLIAVEVQRLVYAEAEIARLEAELATIRRETADLKAVAERAEDERYRELLARRQGYVFPHETRFVGPQKP